jgi:lipid-A-disaccharide synthase
MKIGIVAGEYSGDQLGASLIRALNKKYPGIEWVGIGGPLMQEAGCQSLYPLETLSVMGFIAPLLHSRSILNCFYGLIRAFTQNPIDLFIGIDSPDFNLRLAKRLKAKGIKTVHWVSPSVWAWRQNRIYGIKKAVDLMMVLFPFEQKIYQDHQIPVVLTGHPLADQYSLTVSASMREMAARALELDPQKPILGLLPGSRKAELYYLAEPFLEAARLLKAQCPDLQLVTPVVSEARAEQYKTILKQYSDLNVRVVLRQSLDVLLASKALLLASGTVTLEAMLCKTPMVAAYKMSVFTYAIAKIVIKVPHITLPNLLWGSIPLVPEFIQENATPQKLAHALRPLLFEQTDKIQEAFTILHQQLQRGAGEAASDAVLEMISR